MKIHSILLLSQSHHAHCTDSVPLYTLSYQTQRSAASPQSSDVGDHIPNHPPARASAQSETPTRPSAEYIPQSQQKKFAFPSPSQQRAELQDHVRAAPSQESAQDRLDVVSVHFRGECRSPAQNELAGNREGQCIQTEIHGRGEEVAGFGDLRAVREGYPLQGVSTQALLASSWGGSGLNSRPASTPNRTRKSIQSTTPPTRRGRRPIPGSGPSTTM